MSERDISMETQRRTGPEKEEEEGSFPGTGNGLCKDLEARKIMLYLTEKQLEDRMRQWEEQEKEVGPCLLC